MRVCRKDFRAVVLALSLCLVFSGVSQAAAPRAGRDRGADEARREFSSFVDGFLEGIQKEQQIPGMVFVAVRGENVLYMKGYGRGANDLPADPERTLYRVGSISKIMTAVATLQLVERGRIGLDENVNAYLNRWSLPDTHENPVTLRNLLTHTGGFDDKAYEIDAPASNDERGFVGRLQKRMPARYAPPGSAYSFSNMGYALAGSIIERYSRQQFASAVRKYIFEPLEMRQSAFAPTDEALLNLAPGHDDRGGEVPYTRRFDMPATGMVSTASDMGRFMLAQLGEGALGKNRILPPSYANSMLRRHFSPHPLIDGTGLAYCEKNTRGFRTLQQTGNIAGYSSFLILSPEKKFGIFFAANVEGLDFKDNLTDALARRFFPVSGDAQGGLAPGSPRADGASPDLGGWYRHNRISRHTAEKARNILGPQIRVARDGEGLLLTGTGEKTNAAGRWEATGEPDLFKRAGKGGADGDSYLFFGRNAEGEAVTMTVGEVGETYDKLPWKEAYPWQAAQIAAFLLTAVISFAGALLGFAVNRNRLPWEKGLRAATELWTLSSLFCAMQLAFAAGILLSAQCLGGQFTSFVPYQVKALFVIPLCAGILLAWLWLRLLAGLVNPGHHWAEKLLLLVIVCVETGYMFFLAGWRLLGFMF